jgi:putative PIG3 family NAD(P)H quinone oxidoreductase
MKAIVVAGDEDHSLEWTDVPDPEPGPGQVLVAVEATAVNRADLLQRRGRYPPPEGASSILGLEAAGRIAALGRGVEGRELGARVCALLPGGGYAERVVVPDGMLLEVPEHLSCHEAAALPEVLYTAFVNLCLEADLRPGESVVVHAGASGVGTAALQIARVVGARAVATASAHKLDALRGQFDVHAAIDRRADDLFEQISEALAPGGADVILDPVGADYLEGNLEILARRGRLVLIGLLGGRRAEIDLGAILMRRVRLIGSVLRSRSLDEKLAITRALRERIWPHVTAGEIRPVIDEAISIEEAERAHARLAANDTIGKIVLSIEATDAAP